MDFIFQPIIEREQGDRKNNGNGGHVNIYDRIFAGNKVGSK